MKLVDNIINSIIEFLNYILPKEIPYIRFITKIKNGKKETFMKKVKCVVCKSKFCIEKNKKYLVRDKVDNSILNPIYIDVMDCPYCGCQNYLWKRLNKIKEMPNE